MSFNDVAPVYDDVSITPNWVFERLYKETLGSRFQSDPKYAILEVGIGTGRTVGPLLRLGITLVGIDVSRKMLERLKEKLRKERVKTQPSLVLCDATRLPFRKCLFDRVYAVNVLPFVRNCKRAIEEIKFALKTRGLLVVAIHSHPELQTKLGKTYARVLTGAVHSRNVPETILIRIIEYLRLTSIKPSSSSRKQAHFRKLEPVFETPVKIKTDLHAVLEGKNPRLYDGRLPGKTIYFDTNLRFCQKIQ